MGLQISREELMYHRKNFYETQVVKGCKCTIYSIHDDHEEAYDFYNDIKDTENSYDDSIETYLTYEEAPQIKTLKSLGWYVESEALPVLAYIPFIYQDTFGGYANFSPSIDDRVSIRVNPYDDISSTRDFLIKDFKSNGFPSVIYYTCKLVPYRSN